MQKPYQPAEAPPNSERLRFSVRQMLLATTAIAVYLGLLRWIVPIAFYFAVAAWAGLLFKQLDPNARAAARIAAKIWSGLIIPLSILFLAQNPQSKIGSVPVVSSLVVYGIWILGPAVAIIFRATYAPRLSALLCGYMAAVGGILTWIGPAMATTAAGKTMSIANESPPIWQMLWLLIKVGGCVTVGWIVAATFFAAAVRAWEKSRRNFLSWLMVLVGMVLAICLPVVVLRVM